MNRTFAPALAVVLALAACGPADADNGAAPASPSAASGQDMPAIAQVGFNDLPEKYRNGGQPQPGLCSPPSPPEDVTRPEQLLLFSPAAVVPQESWPDSGIDFNALVNDFETQLIVQALKFTQGNKKEAARLLNLKRTTLLEKIKKKELFGNLPDDDESE